MKINGRDVSNESKLTVFGVLMLLNLMIYYSP